MKFSKKLILNGDLKSIISKACPNKNLIYSEINYTDSSANEFSGLLIQDSIGNLLSSNKIELPNHSILQIKELIVSDSNSVFLLGSLIDSVSNSSVAILKFDSKGRIQWANSYFSTGEISIHSAVKYENSLLICGTNLTENNGLLINVSETGSLISSLKLNSSNSSTFNDISIYSNGFIIVGSVEKEASVFHYSFKSDSIKTYLFNSSGNINSLRQIVRRDLNTFYISGYSDAHSSIAGDAIICKWTTDQSQNARFMHIGVANDFEIYNSVIDSNSIITNVGKAEYYGNGIYNGILLQLDSNLNLLNSTVLQNNFSSELHAIVKPNRKRLGFFGIRNDNTANNGIAYGLIDSDSLSFCEFQNAILDTGTFSPGMSTSLLSIDNVNLSVLPIAIQLSNLNLGIQSICKEGYCKIPLEIQGQKQNLCIGDTINFNLKNAFQNISWKLNDQIISNNSSVSLIYDGESIHLTAEVWDDLGCFGFDEIIIHPKKYALEIEGESKLCLNNSEVWYRIIYDKSLELDFQIINGELIQKSGDSLLIDWKNSVSQVLVYLKDSSNCRLAKKSLEIKLDSGIILNPVIYGLTEDSLVELTRLDFSLQSIPEIQNQSFRLYKVMQDISQYQTILLENESKWIDPDYTPGAGYYIETENNCSHTLRSKTHRAIYLDVENQTLKWTDYLGWSKTNTKYNLIRNGIMAEELNSNNYALKSFEEFESCFRIRAKNLETEYVSFSNMQCIDESLRLVLPDVITPNGDGINERFSIPELQMFPSITLSVYNRWGKLIYSKINYDNTWPDRNIENGTYFYRLSFEKDLGIKNYKGWIEVLK
ncbi:gliding motility-associated C-terminal domain-containing protein [Hyphobacterium sp. CCMP332]|nr:gliding motility-associated C-terminal domain-containing protein [Hyphobacterium sp. CCMP332]